MCSSLIGLKNNMSRIPKCFAIWIPSRPDYSSEDDPDREMSLFLGMKSWVRTGAGHRGILQSSLIVLWICSQGGINTLSAFSLNNGIHFVTVKQN